MIFATIQFDSLQFFEAEPTAGIWGLGENPRAAVTALANTLHGHGLSKYTILPPEEIQRQIQVCLWYLAPAVEIRRVPAKDWKSLSDCRSLKADR